MSHKKQTDIHITSLSAYTRPKIVEDKKMDFVGYGVDNLHFNFLIDRYVGSPTNQAIINGKVNLICGKGLGATDANKYIENWAKFKSILKNEDVKRIIFDRTLLGLGCILITKQGKKAKMTHFPMDTLRSGKANDDGDVDTWYYHPDWASRNKYKKGTDDLKPYKVWTPESKDGEYIAIVRPYVPGFFYYPPVDYEAALPYALLEEEIADYLINDVQNGFSGTKVINYNNGVPSPEEQRRIVKTTKDNLTGSKGLKTIIAFNRDDTKKTTVDDIPLNNAPEHYRYLSEECEAKLLKGHKAPSELLGFKGDSAGFANNAEELKNKMIAFDNYQLKPFQMEFLDTIEPILAELGLSFNLYFKSIEPLEFSDHTAIEENPEEESTTELKLAEQIDELANFISKGEDDSEEWELIDERDVDYELEDDFDLQVQEWETEDAEKNKPKESTLSKIINLISTGTARPNSGSEQDKKIGEYYYKVRYKYAGNKLPERAFCRSMMSSNKLYRKEDIIALEDKVVNPGWGEGGSNTYSIWKYKGGGSCKHKWKRVTFRSTSRTQDVNSPLAETIGTAEAAVRGYRITNDWEVSVTPNSMPNAGFVKPNKGKG